EFKNDGSSITEGIGIMRLVENFRRARVDEAFTLPDQDIVTVAHYLKQHDALVVGSSAALNLAGALKTAVTHGPGKRILTVICDGGERSYSKLYNPDFLREKNLDPSNINLKALIEKYQAEAGM
ncbi:cysteine synthase, partial [bacterium]|nr:cysteine synthase [bacterium]